MDLIKLYLCKSCDYKWQSKKSFGIPFVCPNCKSENIIQYINTEEGRKKYVFENSKYEVISIIGGCLILLTGLSSKNFNFGTIFGIIVGSIFIWLGLKNK